MKRRTTLSLTAGLLLAANLAVAQPLDVNSAAAADLATVEGVGSELAGNIVREREENGPFRNLEDLRRVPGMTDAAIAQLKGRVAVGRAAAPTRQDDGTEDQVRQILKKFDGEPSIRATQQAAIDYMRANPGLIDSWRVRSRLRGLAPQFRVGAGADVDRSFNWPNNTNPTSYLLPPADQPRRDLFGGGADVAAQATWQLDRLIFDPEEPRVNREAVRLSKHMDSVLDDVTRRYYERRRLQVELELNPPTDVADRLRKEIRLQELTADLDGLTGGFFSEQAKNKRGR